MLEVLVNHASLVILTGVIMIFVGICGWAINKALDAQFVDDDQMDRNWLHKE